MKDYLLIEKKIINVLKEQKAVVYQNESYVVKKVAKPRPSKGECKTDVYILLEGKRAKSIEIKLSVKKKNSSEFLENKITQKRAKTIFGEKYQEIIKSTTSLIKNKFVESPLIYTKRTGNVEEGSITMGWRFEVVNKERKLSFPLQMSEKDIINCFYKGANLEEDKRNAKVEGDIIINSGVASHIIICNEEDIKDYNDVLSNMISLDVYKPEKLYLAFISNNYRTKKDKIDGSRALAVYVEWQLINGELTYDLVFNNPLTYTGKYLTNKLKQDLNKSKLDLDHIKLNNKVLKVTI